MLSPWAKFRKPSRDCLRKALNSGNVSAAEQYKRCFGAEAFEGITNLVCDNHLSDRIATGAKEQDLVKSASDLLSLELTNGSRAAHKVMVLATSVRNPKPLKEDDILDPKEYDAENTDDLTKAAKWIVSCSNTLQKNGEAYKSIKNILAQRVERFGRTFENLCSINESMNPSKQEVKNRGIAITGGLLPAPPTGRALLKRVALVLNKFEPVNAAQWKALAQSYFGSITRCHGFNDQNGRTARAMYALCYLHSEVPFEAISSDVEKALSGLRSP